MPAAEVMPAWEPLCAKNDDVFRFSLHKKHLHGVTSLTSVGVCVPGIPAEVVVCVENRVDRYDFHWNIGPVVVVVVVRAPKFVFEEADARCHARPQPSEQEKYL